MFWSQFSFGLFLSFAMYKWTNYFFFVRDLKEVQELNHIVDDWNPRITTKQYFHFHRISPSHRVRSFPKIFISNGHRPYLSRTWFLTWDIAWWVLVSVAIDEKNNENNLVIRSKSGRAEKNMELTLGGGEFGKFFWCLDFCATPFRWGYRDRVFQIASKNPVQNPVQGTLKAPALLQTFIKFL